MYVQNMEINYGSFVLFVDIVLLPNFVATVKNYIQRCKRSLMFACSYNLTTEVNPLGMYVPRLKLITSSFVLILTHALQGGGYFLPPPPLVFLRYLPKLRTDHRQIFNALQTINFTHPGKETR